MVDQKKMEEMKATCDCGSGKMAGMCCKKGEPCFCGSGKPVGECCMADQAGHEKM